jgi:ABC-2 type transport system permease protein
MTEKSQLVGRMILYFVIMYLFSQIFQNIQAPSFQLWYSAMTQVITLSSSTIAFQIAQDMQSGQIAHFLIRPIHYLGYRLCEAMGISFVRYFFLIACYLAARFYVTGSIPDRLLLGMVFGMAGIFLYTLISVLIGLLSFWIKEIKSVFYLNLTATFCFGGLIVPLDFYSPLIRTIGFSTPYPWILWWPAGWMVNLSTHFLFPFLGWCTWIVLLGALLITVYSKCIKSFVMEGG